MASALHPANTLGRGGLPGDSTAVRLLLSRKEFWVHTLSSGRGPASALMPRRVRCVLRDVLSEGRWSLPGGGEEDAASWAEML